MLLAPDLRKMMRQPPTRRRACGGSKPSNCFTLRASVNEEARQGIEQPHRGLSIHGAEVGSGLNREDDPDRKSCAASSAAGFSAILWKSSRVRPKSVRASSKGTPPFCSREVMLA